jgi:hypothetical protein
MKRVLRDEALAGEHTEFYNVSARKPMGFRPWDE